MPVASLARRIVATGAVALALAGCGANSTDPAPAPPTAGPPPASAQVWSREEGFVDAPRVPAAEPVKHWAADVPVGAETAVSATGVVVRAVPDGDGTRVERLDLATGAVAWQGTAPGAPSQVTISGAAAPVVVVETGDPRTVTVFDAADGRVLWQAPEDEGGLADALPDLLLVRAISRTTAIDRATGVRRWQVPYDVTARGGGLVVDGQADSATLSSVDGVADPATGQPLWTQTNPLFTDVTIVGGLFVRTADVEPGPDTVTAFDPATGVQRWTAAVDGIGRASVAPLADDTLLIAGGGGPGLGTVAVSATDGRVLWRADRPLATVLRLDGRTSVVQYDSYRVGIADARTGEVRTATTTGFADIAGGAFYTPDDQDVTATDLRDLAPRWRVAGVGDVYGMDAVPGGFVAVVGSAEPRSLVAYTG
ncbi:MAG: hypothetical protein ABS81_08995 [Pseudonocardia sp. SCN 72-86]|nr:MAG: hypothetical protein ABS81_08995 [Pseudonocardia sp. SCN 72-86]